MEILVEEPFVHISYDKQNNWMYANWIGDQTPETVKTGCLLMLKYVQQKGVTKVLNDNRQVSSSWAGAAEWVGTTWFPDMTKAGVNCFCWIYSSFAFSRLSADTSISYAKLAPKIVSFDDLEEAKAWLKVCQ